MEFNPTRMCELLVGLPDVNVLSVDDVAGEPILVHIEARHGGVWCPGCGVRAAVKEATPAVVATAGSRAKAVVHSTVS